MTSKIKNEPSMSECELKDIMTNPLYHSTMEDGFLRIRITHKCNSKCRFCERETRDDKWKNATQKHEVLYDYCKPLYTQIKTLLLTGGDPLCIDESFTFCKYICTNYPHINLMLETNGIAFTKKWQELAADNLIRVHISLNASNEETFFKDAGVVTKEE